MTAPEGLLALHALLAEVGCEKALVAVAHALFPEPERPIVPAIRFNLFALFDANSELGFCFDTTSSPPDRDKLHNTEALCILLHRLSYPRRHFDIAMRFGRSVPAVCRIFVHMVETIYARYERTLYFHDKIISERIQVYSAAIAAKGLPMTNVFGFIDGMKNAICRPSTRRDKRENLQKQVYSGHKRVHCLNYQCTTASDGLEVHFWGPIEGKRHDITMLRESKVMSHFQQHSAVFDGYAVYGDSAYGVNKYIVSGFKSARLSRQGEEFNSMMSSVRESVE